MAALTPGTIAPQITLKNLDGKPVSIANALQNGPVVVAFFKVSCPTCQFTLPFLQRMYEMYGGSALTFLGVSQDGPGDTRAFMQEFRIKFPVLIDDHGYPASKAYGLTNVPTLFWINPDRKIHISSVGFAKNDLEAMSAEAARATGKQLKPPFRPGETVPAFRPG